MRSLQLSYVPPAHWWQRASWVLVEDYVSPCGVRVPAGFETDGATVPWGLRWLASPTGPAMPAAVVHDWLLANGAHWAYAARQFRRELQALGLPRWRVWLLTRAVLAWGWMRGRR